MKDIKVLGTGCPKCRKLEEMTISAANEMKIEYRIEKVTDLDRIMNYGIMMTPALVVDGAVKIAGRLPGHEDLKRMLS